MPVTKYQVFVSSTYDDLVDERDQVIRAVLEMGHIPVGMEMFSAADEQQWQIISRHIDESDYYAVVIAHRYGSMTESVSYTRKEYEYALAKGIPVLGFVIDPGASWPSDKIDTKPELKQPLDDFKALVKEKPVGFWTSAEDLYGKFSVALTKAITANPREGWVRASSVAGPQVTAELSRLSAENSVLRKELDAAERESQVERDKQLRSLDEQLRQLPLALTYRVASSELAEGDPEWRDYDDLTHLNCFDILGPTLMTETSVSVAARYLTLILPRDHEPRADLIALNQVQDLLSDWSALDLVEPAVREKSSQETEDYWSLSQLGRELLKMQRRRSLERRLKTTPPSAGSDDSPEAEAASAQIRTSASEGTATDHDTGEPRGSSSS